METAQTQPAHPPKDVLLVVDDEEGPRQSLKIIFRDSYDLLLASGGEQALELAREKHPAVAVLDIMMAGMSGVQLLGKLKEIDPAIQVIMLTAYETVDSARQALRLGACDYLTKPYDIATIRRAVSAASAKHRVAKQVEAGLRELDELRREVEGTRTREEAARNRGDIYAGVLHDINGPLTVISAYFNSINSMLSKTSRVEGEELDGVRDKLARIDGQVARCAAISRRYLRFLRDGEGGPGRADVGQVLSDLAELLAHHPSAKGHDLVIPAPAEPVEAAVNDTDLLQILLNIAINALQSSEGDPQRVEVRCERRATALDTETFADGPAARLINRAGFRNEPPLVAVSVQDQGRGIAPDIMPRLFEGKFTTKAAGSGTGVGLSVVRRLVEAASGAVMVRTRPGAGSVFTVLLPALDA